MLSLAPSGSAAQAGATPSPAAHPPAHTETKATRSVAPPRKDEPARADRAAVDWTKPEEAMRELLAAVWFQDKDRLLRCFSRKAAWQALNTGSRPARRRKVTYQELEAGLAPDGDWATAIFGDDEPDFRDYVEQTEHRDWVEVKPLQFSVPGVSKHVWIRWRKEGKRYVVSELAMP